MRLFSALTLAALVFPAASSAVQLRPEVAVGGWFLEARGTVTGTDIESLGFDRQKVQPEFRGAVQIGDRHHLEVSYLRIRRQEEGVVSGFILGVLRFQDPVSLDIAIDDLRFRYGYSLLRGDWIEAEPFLEIGYVREESTTVEQALGQTSHQEESAVYPLPGLRIVFAPAFPVRLQASAAGIGTGSAHLIDVQGGAELAFGYGFAGVGYRHLDALFRDDDDQEVADVRLDGVYLEGGVRF
ncbi:MAG: hypothetical protein ACREQQ_13300 [Candidatus Binatia bacterium]